MENQKSFFTDPSSPWNYAPPHVKQLFQKSLTIQPLKSLFPDFLKQSFGCSVKINHYNDECIFMSYKVRYVCLDCGKDGEPAVIC